MERRRSVNLVTTQRFQFPWIAEPVRTLTYVGAGTAWAQALQDMDGRVLGDKRPFIISLDLSNIPPPTDRASFS
jgi:hypothetical protein